MRIAVVIDPWKLEIFRRHLTQAGYKFEEGKGLTKDMLNFYIETDNPKALEIVTRQAQQEAARTGEPR